MIGQAAKPVDCSDLYKMLAAHSGDGGLIGKVAKIMTEPPGTFTSVAPLPHRR
jgi:hypothetical protein